MKSCRPINGCGQMSELTSILRTSSFGYIAAPVSVPAGKHDGAFMRSGLCACQTLFDFPTVRLPNCATCINPPCALDAYDNPALRLWRNLCRNSCRNLCMNRHMNWPYESLQIEESAFTNKS